LVPKRRGLIDTFKALPGVRRALIISLT